MAPEEKSRNVMMVEEGNDRNVVGVEEKQYTFLFGLVVLAGRQ